MLLEGGTETHRMAEKLLVVELAGNLPYMRWWKLVGWGISFKTFLYRTVPGASQGLCRSLGATEARPGKAACTAGPETRKPQTLQGSDTGEAQAEIFSTVGICPSTPEAGSKASSSCSISQHFLSKKLPYQLAKEKYLKASGLFSKMQFKKQYLNNHTYVKSMKKRNLYCHPYCFMVQNILSPLVNKFKTDKRYSSPAVALPYPQFLFQWCLYHFLVTEMQYSVPAA